MVPMSRGCAREGLRPVCELVVGRPPHCTTLGLRCLQELSAGLSSIAFYVGGVGQGSRVGEAPWIWWRKGLSLAAPLAPHCQTTMDATLIGQGRRSPSH
jgi:hypothetical protein